MREYNINTQRVTQDIADLYTRFEGHPGYIAGRPENTTITDVLVSMIEMILFTNKGEMLGDPDFGADLDNMIWQSRISSDGIRRSIVEQFDKYIPQFRQEDYSVDVEFYKGTLRDIALVYITLNGETISARFD